jgi:hypothetical protein
VESTWSFTSTLVWRTGGPEKFHSSTAKRPVSALSRHRRFGERPLRQYRPFKGSGLLISMDQGAVLISQTWPILILESSNYGKSKFRNFFGRCNASHAVRLRSRRNFSLSEWRLRTHARPFQAICRWLRADQESIWARSRINRADSVPECLQALNFRHLAASILLLEKR